MQEIPERFWSLFRSVNRSTYIEALLKINEEYEYSNYFLSREMCIQLLSSYFAQKRCVIWQDELEEEEDQLEPPAKDRLAAESRRLFCHDREHCHTGLCSGDDRGIFPPFQ